MSEEDGLQAEAGRREDATLFADAGRRAEAGRSEDEGRQEVAEQRAEAAQLEDAGGRWKWGGLWRRDGGRTRRCRLTGSVWQIQINPPPPI